MENMGYEQILAEIAARTANECELTPSEAIGVVMNNKHTEAIIQDIKKGVNIDIDELVCQYIEDGIF